MNDILFTPLRLNELEILIENSVKKALSQGQEANITDPAKVDSDILDIKHASTFLNLAVPTIYSLVSKRILTSYKRGKKLYFKKSELLEWIQTGRRNSISEIRSKAKAFTKAA